MDHLHKINKIVEKAEEYKLPLCSACIDYNKEFDALKISAVFQALENLKNHIIQITYIF